MTAPSPFAKRGSHDAIETGADFAPLFDDKGLILAIAADAATNQILMVAYMNADALAKTIATGEAWFWSRSRKTLWRKGETSGNTLSVVEMRVDCDQDAILMKVRVDGDGVACHRGFRSCFYRTVPLGTQPDETLALAFDKTMPRVDAPTRD
jgi:phosphoribosyl-AMP cyclohydrolase